MIKHTYDKHPVRINYIVVDCEKVAVEVMDNVILRGEALTHLSKNRASDEVRRAVNAWYYT